MQPHAIAGAILGCAVGDAIGLPREGLSRGRANRMAGEPDAHRLLFGRGMVSDDTEHTCMVAQSLCRHPSDPDLFARDFAGRLRWWLLGLPAGVGLATLRACGKLWLGFPPHRSGVFSAGNGPAMRSAVLGAAIDDRSQLLAYVRAGTLITHTDPKAARGAAAVAIAAWCARRDVTQVGEFVSHVEDALGDDTDPEINGWLATVRRGADANWTTLRLADELGCTRGVSGYVYHTAPVALHAWLRHPGDLRAAVREVVACGGDTDTTGAITGAIVGTGVGAGGVPRDWVDRLWEWPRTPAWMVRLADAAELAARTGQPVKPPTLPPIVGLGRNLAFLSIVLCHGMRRMFPPY